MLNNDDLKKVKMIFQSVTQAAQKRKSETMTFWLLVQMLYGEGTPIHYLYGYVPSNVVVILKLLI